MAHELEPPDGLTADWDGLYLARGSDEVVEHRPVLTGDVFEGVTVQAPRGSVKAKMVMVMQHPCAMRGDGVELAQSLLVAEVRRWSKLPPEKWSTNGKIMPLPGLIPTITSSRANQAAIFGQVHLQPFGYLRDRQQLIH